MNPRQPFFLPFLTQHLIIVFPKGPAGILWSTYVLIRLPREVTKDVSECLLPNLEAYHKGLRTGCWFASFGLYNLILKFWRYCSAPRWGGAGFFLVSVRKAHQQVE